MYETIYDNGEVVVGILPNDSPSVCIKVVGHRVYITVEELADIADAAEQHLEIESAAEYVDESSQTA